MTTAALASRAAELVGAFFESALECVDRWQRRLADDLLTVPSGRLNEQRLDDLVRPYAAATLDDPVVPAFGAGFVAATDLLPHDRQHLSWWQGPGRSKLTLASRHFDKKQLDYSKFEWYHVPERTGEPHVAGPSFDYLCCDEYIMTAAVPVMIGGRFVGIAGIDLLVDTVEQHLAPQLREQGPDITVVNDSDRIVLSTNVRLETGDLLPRDRSRRDVPRHRCGSLPLSIMVG